MLHEKEMFPPYSQGNGGKFCIEDWTFSKQLVLRSLIWGWWCWNKSLGDFVTCFFADNQRDGILFAEIVDIFIALRINRKGLQAA